jgi:hypothetical protein
VARKPRSPPAVFQPSVDPDRTAELLLLHCEMAFPGGNVNALARAALEHAIEARKPPPGRPQENDTGAVWMVRAVQRDTGRSIREARQQVVRRLAKSPLDATRMAERLKKKQKTTPEPVHPDKAGDLIPSVEVASEDVFAQTARLRAGPLWFWGMGKY